MIFDCNKTGARQYARPVLSIFAEIHSTHPISAYIFLLSPHVRKSTKVLDSGSQPLDSGSQHLDSGFQPFGFRIPTFWIPDSIPKWRIPDSKTIVDSRFQSLDSGFQEQKLAGFRIPDSLTWGDFSLLLLGFQLCGKVPFALLTISRGNDFLLSVSGVVVSCFAACKTMRVIILSVQKTGSLSFFRYSSIFYR